MAKKNRCNPKDSCVSCKSMGALAKGYSFVKLMGGFLYPLCYKCVRACCGIGRPIRDETYELLSPSSLGPCANFYTSKPLTMAIYPGQPNEDQETAPIVDPK